MARNRARGAARHRGRADIHHAQPALGYLDVVKVIKQRPSSPWPSTTSRRVRDGQAAVAKGWLDEQRTVMEIMTGIAAPRGPHHHQSRPRRHSLARLNFSGEPMAPARQR